MSNDEQKRYAGTLLDGARMYAASADATNVEYPNAMHVLSHLLGMSIELALKAYLVANGLTEKDLRNLGHDLDKLYDKAKELGLMHTGSRNFRLKVLSANYRDREFAYPKEGNLIIIKPSSLREITHEIIIEVFKEIKGEDLLNKMANEPGLSIMSEYPDSINGSAWAVK